MTIVPSSSHLSTRVSKSIIPYAKLQSNIPLGISRAVLNPVDALDTVWIRALRVVVCRRGNFGISYKVWISLEMAL
jgi:hypothetical protein